ncbi:hypothetical protein Tco_0696686 [Tanacetum coccineum]
MNIELEYSVAKLLKEDETLKKHYKDVYDSIKITRSKTIEHTTSLLANNADLKAQIQEKIITRHRFSPNKTSAVYEKTSPRSDLRWKPTGRIFKTVGLRWVPTGKILASCTSLIGQQKQRIDFNAVENFIRSLFDEYFNGENLVVSKSSAVTSADASDKRQQQQDSTSSISTLATTVTADENFDL